MGTVLLSHGGDEGAECFQRLQRALKTDCARQEAVRRRRLGHDGANEIVSKCVNPDFFLHELRSLAAQALHPHFRLHGPEIQFDLPIIIPPKLTAYHASITVV